MRLGTATLTRLKRSGANRAEFQRRSYVIEGETTGRIQVSFDTDTGEQCHFSRDHSTKSVHLCLMPSGEFVSMSLTHAALAAGTRNSFLLLLKIQMD